MDGVPTWPPPFSSSSSYFVQDQNEWFVEGSHLWPILVTGYSLVFTIGVIGNIFLLFALYGSGSGGGRVRALPVRNHLMVNLAAADLFVTGVCVPISACAAASHACWPSFVVSWMCQLSPLLQKTPVAASTLSLALLSLDRWAAFRHPRFAQRFREKRFVIMSMASIWILAGLISAPTFWARYWEDGLRKLSSTLSTTLSTLTYSSDDLTPYGNGNGHYDDYVAKAISSTINSSSYNQTTATGTAALDDLSSWGGICLEKWTNLGLEIAYVTVYLSTAFVSPALIIAACHASVSQKLTSQLKPGALVNNDHGGGRGALSSAAANRVGMERLDIEANRQKPKQVIIVAHDAHNNLIQHHQHHGEGDGGGGGVGCKPTTEAHSAQPFAQQHRKIIPCDPNSDDEDDECLRIQIQADLESFRQVMSNQAKRNSSCAAKKTSTGKRRKTSVGGSAGAAALFKSLHPNACLHREQAAGESSSRSRSRSPSTHNPPEIEEEEEELQFELPSRSHQLAFIDSSTELAVIQAAEQRRRSSVGLSASSLKLPLGGGGASLRSKRHSIPALVFGEGGGQAVAEGLEEEEEDEEEEDAIQRNNNSIHVKPIRAAKHENSIIRSHRRFRKKLLNNEKRQMMLMTMPSFVQSPSLLPTYSSQSFRSRRRAANLMAALAVVFVLCWLPYVICTIWDMCTSDKDLVRLLLPFALFLGHAHSAINPVVSWRLNRSAFVRFQKKSFFASLLPDWNWVRVLRLSCRSVASCRYYCCSFTGNNCCCCSDNFEVRNSSEDGPDQLTRREMQQQRWPPPQGNYGHGGARGLSPYQYNARGGVAGRQTLASAIKLNKRHQAKRNSYSTYARLKYHLCCQWCCCCKKRRGGSAHFGGGGGGGGGYRSRRRRTSSPEGWNTSTNEAALGAFHPKYLNRLPMPDPISKCHTSHFLR